MDKSALVEQCTIVKKAHASKEAGSKVGADVAVVLDFEGCTVGQVAELAARTVIINLQSRWRKVLKDGGSIPESVTVKVKEYESGPTLEEMIASLPPEARKALLEKYGK